MIAQLFTNGLMQADIIVLGRYLSLSARAGHVGSRRRPSRPAQAANEWVAVYRACQLFAFLPYQMLFSVTQVLFPMVARAKAEDGGARVAELVRRGCRIGAIVCGMLVVVVARDARVAHQVRLRPRGRAARHRARCASSALGQAAFAMLGLATTVLVSLGRERTRDVDHRGRARAARRHVLVPIPHAAFGAPQLAATAAATTTALVCALVVGVVRRATRRGRVRPVEDRASRRCCASQARTLLGGVTPMFSKLLTPIVAAGDRGGST